MSMFDIKRRPSGGVGKRVGRFGLAVEVTLVGTLPSGTPGEFTDPTVDWLEDNTLTISGSFNKGVNWQMYKDAVIALGASGGDIIEDATTINFRNTALARFCSLFDIVVFDPVTPSSVWPGVTPKFIGKVKSFVNQAREKRRNLERCHCLFFPWKDDMPTGLVQSSLWNYYYTALRDQGMIMVGTGPNANGCNHVDKDEAAPWPGGPYCLPGGEPRPATGDHNWLLDYRTAGFADLVATLSRTQYDTFWNAGGAGASPIDGYMVHDVLWYPNPAISSTTNAPVISNVDWEAAANAIFTAYRNAFSGSMATLFNGVGRLVGPDGDPNHAQNHIVANCKAVNYNFIFSANHGLPKVISDMQKAASHEALCMLGNFYIDSSFTTMFTEHGHNSWWEILKAANAVNWEDNVYVTMTSNGPGSRLFWHPCMRPVI